MLADGMRKTQSKHSVYQSQCWGCAGHLMGAFPLNLKEAFYAVVITCHMLWLRFVWPS